MALLFAAMNAWAGPAVSFTSLLGSDFVPVTVASDGAGNAYVLGPNRVIKVSADGRRQLYDRPIEAAVAAIAVDAAGNAFLTGSSEKRAFVTKLSPEGEVVFSKWIGGDFESSGQAILVTPDGEIVVSGTSVGGYPVTEGAFKPATTPPVFLTKLDATATRVVFAIYGIGGSSLAVDAGGNLFVAGSTTRLDYPTTPGAYQERFRPAWLCAAGSIGGCFQGQKNQYVSKVDATGSTLIYSTALTWYGDGPVPPCEPVCFPPSTSFTDHRGFAIDQEGNAYVTGLTARGYPFTIDPPLPAGVPFLTKLNPTGTRVIYSTPIGGQSVSITPDGSLHTAGNFQATTSFRGSITRNPWPLGFDNDGPFDCIGSSDQAYVSHVDRESGHVLSTRRVDGSAVGTSGTAAAIGGIWIAGYTASNQLLLSGEAPIAERVDRSAYLARYDFESDAKISCLSRLPFQRLGVVAPGELVRIWGKDFPIGTIAVTVDGVNAVVEAAGETTIDFRVPFVSRAPYVTMRVFSEGREVGSAKIALQ